MNILSKFHADSHVATMITTSTTTDDVDIVDRDHAVAATKEVEGEKTFLKIFHIAETISTLSKQPLTISLSSSTQLFKIKITLSLVVQTIKEIPFTHSIQIATSISEKFTFSFAQKTRNDTTRWQHEKNATDNSSQSLQERLSQRLVVERRENSPKTFMVA